MKRFFRVTWPDGKQELLIAEDLETLFNLLDEEGNPDVPLIEELFPKELPPLRIDPDKKTVKTHEGLDLAEAISEAREMDSFSTVLKPV